VAILGSVSSRECLGAAAILPTTEDCGRTETPGLENEPKREKSSKRVQQILKSTNKVKSTLKLIIFRCCFYLTHIFEVARFEVLISGFSGLCFQNL